MALMLLLEDFPSIFIAYGPFPTLLNVVWMIKSSKFYIVYNLYDRAEDYFCKVAPHFIPEDREDDLVRVIKEEDGTLHEITLPQKASLIKTLEDILIHELYLYKVKILR